MELYLVFLEFLEWGIHLQEYCNLMMIVEYLFQENKSFSQGRDYPV